MCHMRILLYAGPSSGKSTTAARLFADLKQLHHSIELVSEYVKTWAYQKRQIHPYDQVYLFGKQQQSEYKLITAGVKNIVSDSPCFLSAVYSEVYSGNDKLAQPLYALERAYEEDHPSISIFLERGEKPYQQEGRYQSYEEAKKIDEAIITKLWKHNKNFVPIPFQDYDKILAYVLEHIDK